MTTETKNAPVLTFLSEIGETKNLTIVTPGKLALIGPSLLAQVELAQAMHREGKHVEAAALVLKIEARLGVTAEDRLAAARGEPWEDDLEAALKALFPEPETTQAPEIISLQRDFRRLNGAERRAVEAAARELQRAKTPGNKELARTKIARIGARLHQRVELKERADGIAETITLAKDRGEEVEEKPATGGAAHMISRDALAHMLKLGHITRAQYAAGLAYRRAFEARGADLQASQISDTGGGKGHDNDAFVARKLEQAKEAEFAKACEVRVRMECSIEHLSALQMLQWVAGMGRSMRDFGKGGRAYDRNRAALGRALDMVLAIAAEQRVQEPQNAA